jgi:hypothetical protein
MIVVQEVLDQETKAAAKGMPVQEEVPFARRMLEAQPARPASVAAAE